MKKFYLLLILFFAALTINAQDPQLFENDWHIYKVIVDNDEIFAPYPFNETVIGEITFLEDMENVDIACCQIIYSGIEYDLIENFFNLQQNPTVLLGDCINADNIYFSGKHNTVYYDSQLNAKNPFYYSIVIDGENLMLTIENNLGDKAVYGNVLLTNQDLSAEDFSISPNPTSSILNLINTSQYIINKVKVYNALGKIVLEQNNPPNQIDISSLSTGLLFIHIQTENGSIIKKVLKE